jgi:hypothetical protein
MNPINTPLAENLAELTNRLFWLSESEFPFQIITWDTDRVTIEQLLKLTYHPPHTPVQTLGIDEFFAPALQGYGGYSYLLDPVLISRYRTLYSYLTYFLHNIQVYRVGTHPIYIYIIGLTRDENLAGVATQVIETVPGPEPIYNPGDRGCDPSSSLTSLLFYKSNHSTAGPLPQTQRRGPADC